MDNEEIKLGWYKHFKGGIYKVVGLAKHSETLETMVIYHHLGHNDELWARPAKMWHEKVINSAGEEVPRFDYLCKDGD